MGRKGFLSLALLLASILAPTAGFSQDWRTEQESWSARQILLDHCRHQHWLCVVDLTARPQCRIRIPRWNEPPNKILSTIDTLPKDCPSYGWSTAGKLHFFGPLEATRSRLDILVGPLRMNESGQSFLDDLFRMTDLPVEQGPEGIDVGGNSSANLSVPLHTYFAVERVPFRSAIITAAKQLGPSFWAVECYDSYCNTFVEDYGRSGKLRP